MILWTDYFAQTRMVRGGVIQAVAEQQGRGLLSLMVHNHARVMAYLDPFWVFAIMALAALPLDFLMKKAVATAWFIAHRRDFRAVPVTDHRREVIFDHEGGSADAGWVRCGAIRAYRSVSRYNRSRRTSPTA